MLNVRRICCGNYALVAVRRFSQPSKDTSRLSKFLDRCNVKVQTKNDILFFINEELEHVEKQWERSKQEWERSKQELVQQLGAQLEHSEKQWERSKQEWEKSKQELIQQLGAQMEKQCQNQIANVHASKAKELSNLHLRFMLT